jgi:adenylate kinase
MVIVVTGMVGLNKKQYLQEVCAYAVQQGQELALCHVGDMMYAEASDVPPGKILDISLKRLSSLRRSVFKDIIAHSQKTRCLLINTHATFRWRHGLFPAVDFDQMRELNPDMYICVIDGVAALHHRLSSEHSVEHTLKDLIVWREEEIIGTEMLRRGINDKTPFYCLAQGNQQRTVETFYRLVFKPQMKKAYLSFPMTAVMGLGQVHRQIADFRQRMQEHFICFDPGDLEEADLPHLARQAMQQRQETIEIALGEACVRLSCAEISQTYARDFMLIDQADMIISFIPALRDGRAAISSGVERELQHAHEGAKEVYVIWQAAQTPSVFVTQTANAVFQNIEQALAFFTKRQMA